jgi:hypothetical protein
MKVRFELFGTHDPTKILLDLLWIFKKCMLIECIILAKLPFTVCVLGCEPVMVNTGLTPGIFYYIFLLINNSVQIWIHLLLLPIYLISIAAYISINQED